MKLSFQQRFYCPLLRGSDGVPRDDLYLSRFHALSGPAQTDIQPERNARLAETAFFERTGELFCRLGQNSYLPLKLNMSGVMPIIFASALVSIPGTIGSFLQIDQTAHPVWYAFFHTFNYTSWLYVVIYLLLILAFNYFYVAIQYNPVEIANNLRRNNGSIPGFRPGKPTSDFITRTLNKITLIGAIFLAAVAVLPIILGNLTGMSIQLGGTSLLIVVGVALDTTRSLDSFMTMRNHKGFLG